MTGAAFRLEDSRTATSGIRALRAVVVPRADLALATVDEAYALFASVYDGTNRARFVADLSDKNWVVLLRDRDDGALRGFSTILLRDITTPRGPARLFFSGDTVVSPLYWGDKALQLAIARLLLSLKLRQPSRPMYWFLISKGYRTYLILANTFPRSIPRASTDEDPELRAILDGVASARFPDAYDARTGIIRNDGAHEYVRSGVAPVSERALQNSHVRFFVDRNPHHAAGDELACLALVRTRDLVRATVRFTVRRALRMIGFRGATAAR